MSIPPPQPGPSLYTASGAAVHVLAGAGVTTWFSGDTGTTKLVSQLADGSLGLIETSVPPRRRAGRAHPRPRGRDLVPDPDNP